jgi:hypothetical protein
MVSVVSPSYQLISPQKADGSHKLAESIIVPILDFLHSACENGKNEFSFEKLAYV